MVLTLIAILIMHSVPFPSKEKCLINWVQNVIYRSLATGRSATTQSPLQAKLLLLGDYGKRPLVYRKRLLHKYYRKEGRTERKYALLCYFPTVLFLYLTLSWEM